MQQPTGQREPKYKPGDKVVRVGMLGLFGVLTIKRAYWDLRGDVIYTVEELPGTYPEYVLRLYSAEGKEDAPQKEKSNQELIDELLDEANDYRRLYFHFGDWEYRCKEILAYEKLREVVNKK